MCVCVCECFSVSVHACLSIAIGLGVSKCKGVFLCAFWFVCSYMNVGECALRCMVRICRLTPPYQNVAVCLCYLTRVTSHPFKLGWSQWGCVVFMPSGTTHSPPVFHGWLGGGDSRDEILKCATYAFPSWFA